MLKSPSRATGVRGFYSPVVRYVRTCSICGARPGQRCFRVDIYRYGEPTKQPHENRSSLESEVLDEPIPEPEKIPKPKKSYKGPSPPRGWEYGTNSGHGILWKRPDLMKVNCGGPRFCQDCKAAKQYYKQFPLEES